MPKSRARGAARRTSIAPLDDAVLLPSVLRLVEVGVTAVTCFVAWLWSEPALTGFGSATRFPSLAPNPFLAQTLPAYLVSHGLLVEHPAPARALYAAAAGVQRWRIADDLGSPMDAEFTALLAIAQLRTAPLFVEEACELWRTLVVAELVGFLGAELSDHQFDEAWALQIERGALGVVDSLSTTRGFYFCWLAVRDLASAYLRFPGARDRLPQTLKNAFESKLRKAHHERWSARDFARHARSPESALASVFSTVVTQLRDDYLLLPPSPANLRL